MALYPRFGGLGLFSLAWRNNLGLRLNNNDYLENQKMNSTFLKALLVIFALLIYWVSFQAVYQSGWSEGMVFVSDFSHPWRAQFNTDFSLHIILLALWVFWRSSNLAIGTLCGLGCFMGGLFTFPYLLVTLILNKGDIRKLMLGRHT